MKESILANGDQQINVLEEEIRNNCTEQVAKEVLLFVQTEVEQKISGIREKLERSFTLDKMYEKLNNVKNQDEYKKCLKEFLSLTNPSDILRKLDYTFNFHEIKKKHINFMMNMSKSNYGAVFKRYKLDSKTYDFLQVLVMEGFSIVEDRLKAHIVECKPLSLILKEMNDIAHKNAFIKIGARVVGFTLAGTLGSMAGRGIAHYFTNNTDDSDITDRLSRSLETIENTFNHFSEALFQYLDKLRQNYYTILLTLYGGTILKVSRDLNQFKMEISSLSILDKKVEITLTQKEQLRLLEWFNASVKTINQFFQSNEYDKALIASNKMYDFVVTNDPMVSKFKYTNGQSLRYVARTYKMAALCYKADELKQDVNSFNSFMTKLFDKLPFTVSDNDLTQLGAPAFRTLLMKYVYQTLIHQFDTRSLCSFTERMVQRYEGENYLPEERISRNELLLNLILLIYRYFYDKDGKYLLFTDYSPDDSTIYVKLRTEYKSIGKRDEFYKFISEHIGIHPLFMRISVVALILLVGIIPFILPDEIIKDDSQISSRSNQGVETNVTKTETDKEPIKSIGSNEEVESDAEIDESTNISMNNAKDNFIKEFGVNPEFVTQMMYDIDNDGIDEIICYTEFGYDDVNLDEEIPPAIGIGAYKEENGEKIASKVTMTENELMSGGTQVIPARNPDYGNVLVVGTSYRSYSAKVFALKETGFIEIGSFASEVGDLVSYYIDDVDKDGFHEFHGAEYDQANFISMADGPFFYFIFKWDKETGQYKKIMTDDKGKKI